MSYITHISGHIEHIYFCFVHQHPPSYLWDRSGECFSPIHSSSKQLRQQAYGSIRPESSKKEDSDGLWESKGGEKRRGARYNNRFRCLTLTASRLDNQHCLLAKDKGCESGEKRCGNPEEKNDQWKEGKTSWKIKQWMERGCQWGQGCEV